MKYKKEFEEIQKKLDKIERTGFYDVDKLVFSFEHMINQLDYFYCHLVPTKTGDPKTTTYNVNVKPKVHELAYFNIGRGFPKELADAHWCYILKDFGYKVLVIPCTSIKPNSKPSHPFFEKDITIKIENDLSFSRLQISDIRTLDIQRLDKRKGFIKVITPRQDIVNFLKDKIF